MKKGVILIVVIGILIVVFTLALVALYLLTQESRIAEHKIRRIAGVFTARAAMVHTLEELRRGVAAPTWAPAANLNGIPNGDVAITVTPGIGPSGTNQVDVQVNYQP